MAELIMQEEASAPSTPASGKWKVYFKNDGLYIIDDAGNELGPLGTGSGGGSGGGDVIRTKYIITPSIATNDLTVALKYIDGNDPTSTNKLTFRVGNTEYDLTAAMSFTKTDGTNWCNAGSAELAAKNVQYFLYAIGETGGSAGLKFGFSRIPYARTMADFVNTTTDPRYIAGNWTNFNSTDPVTVIGRFQAQLSASASYNWSIPTANVVNYPIYETDILSWTPTYSGSGSLTYTTVTTLIASYQIISRNCLVTISTSAGTTGGTASSTIYTSPPISSLGSTLAYPLPGLVRDATSGPIPPGGGGFDESIQKIYAVKTDASNYGLGTGRRFSVSGNYPIG